MSWAYDANGYPTWVPWIVGEPSTSQVIQYVGGKWVPSTLSTPAPVNASYVTLSTDATLTSERVLTGSSSVGVTDAGAGSTVTLAVPANGIADGQLRQSAGLSVIGRSANSTGDVADITGTQSRVLAVSNTNVLGFSTVATAMIASNAVSDAKLRQGAAHTLIGRSANSTGDVADISVGTDEGLFNVAGVLTSQKTKLANIDATVQSPAQGTEGTRQIYTSTPAAVSTSAGAAGSSVQAAAGDHTHYLAPATASVAGHMTAAYAAQVNQLTQIQNPLYTFPSYGTITYTADGSDFTSGATALVPFASTSAGTGAGISAINGPDIQGRIGYITASTGTTATGSSGVYMNGGNVLRFGGGSWYMRADVYLSAASDGTNTYTARVGFIDSTGAETTDGVFLRYTHSVNSGNWVFVARDNGSETTVSTTVAPATSIATTQTIEITVNAAGNSANCYINGTLANATPLTALPTASGRSTSIGFMILKSAGLTARSIGADCMYYSFARTTPI